MRKPTVKQCKLIEKELGLDYTEWLVRKWREFKDGIEISLVHRQTKERLVTEIRKETRQ